MTQVILGQIDRFSNSYFINKIYEFILLDSEIKNSKSISELKRKLLSLIRPTKKAVLHKFYNDGNKIVNPTSIATQPFQCTPV